MIVSISNFVLTVCAVLLLSPPPARAASVPLCHDPPKETDPFYCHESYMNDKALAPTNGLPYNPMIPPRVSNAVPVEVKVGLQVFKIVDVSVKAATMQLSCWIRMSWTDPRLSWNDTYPLLQTASSNVSQLSTFFFFFFFVTFFFSASHSFTRS